MSTDQAAKPYRATAFADSKPELSAPGATPERLEHLKEHGFLIINDFVDSPLDPDSARGRSPHHRGVRPRQRLQQDRLFKSLRAPHRRGRTVGDSGTHPSGFQGA